MYASSPQPLLIAFALYAGVDLVLTIAISQAKFLLWRIQHLFQQCLETTAILHSMVHHGLQLHHGLQCHLANSPSCLLVLLLHHLRGFLQMVLPRLQQVVVVVGAALPSVR